MKKPLTQIAFDFALPDSTPPPAPAEPVKEVAQEEVAPAAEHTTAPAIEEITTVAEELIETLVETIPPVTPRPERKAPVIVDLPVLNGERKKSTRGRKSIKELSASVDLVEIPSDEVLFQKLYYPIGQVASWFKVNPSLIRLWENEFDVLKPRKNGKGDRLFRPEDVKNIQLIHHLTREKKYTLEGAKDYFRNNKKAEEKFAAIESLKRLKGFLNELKASL